MDALSLLNKAQAAYSSGQYEEALDLLTIAEAEGKLCPESMLLKAACIQFLSNTDYSLNNALDIYLELLKVRPADPRALSEAGFFLLNVKDDAKEAKQYLSRTVDVYRGLFVEALTALFCAEMELGSSRQEISQRMDDILKLVDCEVADRVGRLAS